MNTITKTKTKTFTKVNDQTLSYSEMTPEEFNKLTQNGYFMFTRNGQSYCYSMNFGILKDDESLDVEFIQKMYDLYTWGVPG